MHGLNKDQMEDRVREYKTYLRDSLDDSNFDITEIEDFDDWLKEEEYWNNVRKNEIREP